MSFRSYTIPLVIFRDQVPFERTPNNFDINLGREGEVEGQQKADQWYFWPRKPRLWWF